MKKEKIILERPEIDFSSHFSDRKVFDNNISVFNKLKQLILSLPPLNGCRFELLTRLNYIFLRAHNIELKNPSLMIKSAINDKRIPQLTSIAEIVVVKNLIPYVMNSLKKIDDSEYNGSIFKYIRPQIEDFSTEEMVRNALGSRNELDSSISIYNYIFESYVAVNLRFKIAVNSDDKFSKYVDTGQELIDLGLSKKRNITEEKRQILKNAGLLKLNI